MKFAAFAMIAASLLLLSALPVCADDKKADKEEEEKEEAKAVESPWTEEQLQDFVKTGLKVTYTHKESTVAAGHPLFNEPVVEVKEADDKLVKYKYVDFEISIATERAVCKPIDLDAAPDWSAARNGLFNRPVAFGQKLETYDEQLKVGKKHYDCTVYTLVAENGTDKDRWWVCADLPGIVLKFQDLGVAKINGAIVKDYASEYYEATDIEIPKDSVTPTEREKLDKKAKKDKK